MVKKTIILIMVFILSLTGMAFASEQSVSSADVDEMAAQADEWINKSNTLFTNTDSDLFNVWYEEDLLVIETKELEDVIGTDEIYIVPQLIYDQETGLLLLAMYIRSTDTLPSKIEKCMMALGNKRLPGLYAEMEWDVAEDKNTSMQSLFFTGPDFNTYIAPIYKCDDIESLKKINAAGTLTVYLEDGSEVSIDIDAGELWGQVLDILGFTDSLVIKKDSGLEGYYQEVIEPNQEAVSAIMTEKLMPEE